MLKVTIAAALALTSLAAPAAAQIGSGATSNGYGYGNGPPGGGYPGGGYPGGGGYPQRPQTITCASQNFARRRCPVDTRGGVTILQQQSKSACVQGGSWGYDPGGIWVRNGCAAIFVVGRTRPGYGNGGGNNGGYPGGGDNGGYPGGGPGAGAGYGRVISCSSINYQPARCAVDVYNGARLVKDISGSCNRRNWGWDRGGVWVANGCRGRFEVF